VLHEAVRAARLEERTQARDEDLMVDIIRGDTDALAAVYDRHGGLVFTVALRITADPLAAEEVTQDVFQIVWTRAHTFRPATGTLAAWIIGITRHCAVDKIRARPYQRRQSDLWLDETPQGMLGDGTHFEEQAALRGTVRAALATLPPEQCHVLELAYYGGLSAAEIATSLAVPIGTVKTRLRLGLVKLRAALAPLREQEVGAD
jgi:RNA polymerase sigma-70 factor (ECF subfamily)